ncbi:unnamed protein product [Lactuca saligna]|uniref:Uncharacterized protein n=1 Tax=Lactuca saligna TaxID=75948 RepID=A0AA35YKG1_LACSI|nr:unnamed protein product [Lactuca saligna]
MSFRSRAWMVAGTVGVVEALKDQGFARWNTTIRTIHHHAKSNLRSIAQAKTLTSPAAMASSRNMEEKAKQSEESLRKETLSIEILDMDSTCLEKFQTNKSTKGLISRWICIIKRNHSPPLCDFKLWLNPKSPFL